MTFDFDSFSVEYGLECGVRQGGLTSPGLFNLYMNGLVYQLSRAGIGCHIDGVCMNNINYADAMALLRPSIGALRKLVTPHAPGSQYFIRLPAVMYIINCFDT